MYNVERSIQFNREAVEASYAVGDPEIIRNGEINLGDAYLLAGELEQAQHFLEKAYQDSQQSGKWGEEWMKWRYVQHCCHSLGDAQKALRLAETCVDTAEATNSRKNMAKGWRLRGQALADQENLRQAEEALQRALSIATEIGNPPQVWKTYQAIGALFERKNEYEPARAAYANALSTIDEVAAELRDQAIKSSFLSAQPVQELRERWVGARR